MTILYRMERRQVGGLDQGSQVLILQPWATETHWDARVLASPLKRYLGTQHWQN